MGLAEMKNIPLATKVKLENQHTQNFIIIFHIQLNSINEKCGSKNGF